MKFNLIQLFVLSVFVLAQTACKEIIEPSISKKQVEINAPINNLQTANYNVSFWWNDIEDALGYRLQIVTPKFDSVGSLIVDTLVKSDKFSFTLEPGKYQWKIRAENGSSQTAFTTPRNITVYQSSITQQTVVLSGPANTTLTNQSTVNLQWGNIYGATQYHLQIDTNNFANTGSLVFDQNLPGAQYNFKFPRDQTYQWRVRAENDTTQSKWSAVYSITYDHTPPQQVTLSAPADNGSVQSPVNLQWAQPSGATKFKLYMYKSDSTTLYNANFPMLTQTANYSFTSGTSGEKIYWKVSAVDAAGNEGPPSTLRSFSIQ